MAGTDSKTAKLKILIGICLAGLIFLTGFLANYALNYIYINQESPFLIGLADLKHQPSDTINGKNIEVYEDRIVIYVNDASLSQFRSTGSMLPTLGENANGIEIKPESPEQIEIGDIIAFQYGNIMIIHRVIDKGVDSKGYYFVTKGDNNQEADGKVYWEQVRYVTVGLLY